MKPHLLLIEDNDLNRDLVEQLLEDDYVVTSRVDGTAGLEAALTLHPDAVLLDLSLPGMDGWEIARRLRQRPDTATIPILALTAHAMPGDAERAIAAGVDAYLTKPIHEDELFSILRRLVPGD